MDAKHTPGPWKADGVHWTDATGGRPHIIRDAEGYAVADARVYYGQYGHDESRDNARLIAAAPELLEACKLACEQFETLDDADKLTESDLVAWGIISAAIAKATGSTPCKPT